MRDFVILVTVCVGVVIAVGWYLLPGTARNPFRTTVAVQSPTPEPEKLAPPPEKPHKAVHKADKMPVAEIVKPVALHLPATIVLHKPMVVPAPGEVKLGADRSRIIDSYGDPSLLAATEDRGHLFETMVYRQERKQAIIRLEDGVVASVYAK